MTISTLMTYTTPLPSLSPETISLVQVVLCIGSLQIILYYILIRHIDARLAKLEYAGRLNRVDLAEGDVSQGSRQDEEERDENGDEATVVEPFMGPASPIAPQTSTVSSSYGGSNASGSGPGYGVYNNTHANHLELSLNTHFTACRASVQPAQTCSYSHNGSSSSSWPHIPTLITQRVRHQGSPTLTYERPALYRSQSNPRPYRATSGSYIPSPLSRQCSLPCSPVYSNFGSSATVSAGTSINPCDASASASGSASLAGPSRSATPVHSYRPTLPAPAPLRENELHANAEADRDGPALYTTAKLSFRRHKDAYASLSFGSDMTITSARTGRRQSRTEWVDLPPMYDEAWSQSRSLPQSPIDGGEVGGRSATL